MQRAHGHHLAVIDWVATTLCLIKDATFLTDVDVL